MDRFQHRMPFGAEMVDDGVRFRVWAPDRPSLALCLRSGGRAREIAMPREGDGWFETVVAGARAGDRYRFRVDEALTVPDPASRFQPDDVHGDSEVIDPLSYTWKTDLWRGRPWEEAVLYELHVGAFTPDGTCGGVASKLDHLVELGVTTIELMPVADFPGRRDWGYDGAFLFAPDSVYGRPDDLKALIDAAHARGLMVFLDVVYNHFGPEGNYLHVLARERFFDGQRHTPWGAAINYDGPGTRPVRDFVVNNVLYWLQEYRFDGLRFDAVDRIDDRSARHILDEIAETARAAVDPGRHIHLVLENDANEAHRYARDGAGRPRTYTAQWNDDIHHAFHCALTGEGSGYYADFVDDPIGHLGRALAEGFAYQGEPSGYRDGQARGEPSTALPPAAFVSFLQNHDQVGNRAFGERIAALATPAAVAAATALLLLAPAPPLLFMGQEWGSTRPFLFFCDFGGDLRAAVRDGRRREFAALPEFAEAAARDRIPDPGSQDTFNAGVLDWDLNGAGLRGTTLALHRDLLRIRADHIVPRLAGMTGHAGQARRHDAAGLAVTWRLGDGADLSVFANLGADPCPLPKAHGRLLFATHAPDDDASAPGWYVAWHLNEVV